MMKTMDEHGCASSDSDCSVARNDTDGMDEDTEILNNTTVDATKGKNFIGIAMTVLFPKYKNCHRMDLAVIRSQRIRSQTLKVD